MRCALILFACTMSKRKYQDIDEGERIAKRRREDIFFPNEILMMIFLMIFENKRGVMKTFNKVRLASKDFNAIVLRVIRDHYSREFGFKIIDRGAIWHDLMNSGLLFVFSCENECDVGSIDFSLRHNVTHLFDSLSSEFAFNFCFYSYLLIRGRRIFQKRFKKNYVMSHDDYFHGGEEMVVFFLSFSKRYRLGDYYSYGLRKVNRARPLFFINVFKKFRLEHEQGGSHFVRLWEARCSLSLLKEWLLVREKCCIENVIDYPSLELL